MSITVDCRACHRKLKVQDEAAGKKIKCPNCSAVFRAIPSVTDTDLSKTLAPPMPTPRPAASEPVAKKEPPPTPPARPLKAPTLPNIAKTQPLTPPPAKAKPLPTTTKLSEPKRSEPLAPPARKPPESTLPAEPLAPRKPIPAAPVEPFELAEVEPAPRPAKAAPPPAAPPPVRGPRKAPGTGNTVGVFLVFGLYIVAVLGGVGFWGWTKYQRAATTTPASAPAVPLTRPATDPIPPKGEPANDLEKEIEQAGKGVKFVPIEVTMSGVTVTMMAPADSRAWSNGGSAGVDDASFRHFHLFIAAGKIDHMLAKRFGRTGQKKRSRRSSSIRKTWCFANS